MREVLKIMSVVVLVVVAGGCANLGNGAVDIPGVGAIPVAGIAGVADNLAPGSGALINESEAQLAAFMGKTPPGPFGSIPFTTSRQVVLKDGTVIPEEKILKILEILTPVVPDAITREVMPQGFVTVPVPDTAKE